MRCTEPEAAYGYSPSFLWGFRFTDCMGYVLKDRLFSAILEFGRNDLLADSRVPLTHLPHEAVGRSETTPRRAKIARK